MMFLTTKFPNPVCSSTVETCPPDSNPTPAISREVCLQELIQNAHQINSFRNYPIELALQLVDRA